jgi:RNA-binding protein
MKGARAAKLRAKGQSLAPTAYVGKAGITPSVVEELKGQLRNNALVKVRFAASMEDRDAREAAAKELARGCGAELVEVRGRTALLAGAAGSKGK